MLLAGKKVVVGGGWSGIGLETAPSGEAEGAEVIVASRNAERVKAVAEKLGATGIAADVTSDDSVAALFKTCGQVDHVVVTAAQLRSGPFKTVSMDDVRATMEGKFWGAWRVPRAPPTSAPAVRSRWSPASSASARGRPRRSSARPTARSSRSTRSLALELSPVRVNCVSPGIIDTPIRAAMPEAARRDMLAKVAAALPVGRVGVGEDIARQILAFMTIGFATGSIVYLDGGGLII